MILPELTYHNRANLVPGQTAGMMGPRHDPWVVKAAARCLGQGYNTRGACPDCYEFMTFKGQHRHQAKPLFATPKLELPAGVDLNRTLPPDMPLDSLSILPSLRDPDDPTSLREYVYNEHFKPNGFVQRTLDKQALRDDRWKIMRLQFPERVRFFDLQATEPGTDGNNLCPCPENLSGEALLAYQRLAEELDAIRSP